jgi:hypothetical protein
VYITLCFTLHLTTSPDFSILADKVLKGEVEFIPITVIAAILIFIAKEISDFLKKRRESKRKIFAYKSLISEEIELNLWTHKRLTNIIQNIEDQKKEHPNANYKILIKESGNEYIHGYDGEKLIESCLIPIIHDKYYEKLISNIAELDANLFNLAQSSYQEVRNMAHVRSSLIKSLLAEENNEPFPHDISENGFLEYAKQELVDTYDAMNALYKECTGNELQEFRLR